MESRGRIDQRARGVASPADPGGSVLRCPIAGFTSGGRAARKVRRVLFGVVLMSSGPARAQAPPEASEGALTGDASAGAESADPPVASEGSAGPQDEPDPFEAPSPELPASERARAWFLRGAELFARRHFIAAAEAYDASFAAAAAPSTRYNAAYSYDLGGAPLRAIEAYEDFLALLAAEGASEGVEPASLDAILEEGARKARRRVEALDGELARIDLQLAPEDAPAGIEVDGEPRAREAFPLRVLPGAHRVEVTRADGTRVVETFEALPGERVRLRIAAPVPVPVDPSSDPAADLSDRVGGGTDAGGPAVGETSRPQADIDRRRSARQLRIAGWTVTAGAGASAVGAGVLGGLTLRAKRDFEDNLCGEGCVYDPSLERSFERRKGATNVMVGVSAGLGALGVALLVAGHLRGRESASSGAEAALQPRWLVKAGGLTLRF